jgi:hypothetical protein
MLILELIRHVHLEALHTSSPSFDRSITSRPGELPEQIRQLIHRRDQRAHDSLEYRMFAGAWVAAR